MERSKLKTIIILILLTVNVFLLFLVGGELFRERRAQYTALENAAQILEQNGISIPEDTLREAGSVTLTTLSAARDLEAEGTLARALLGEDAACTDQSGGLYVYTSQAGTALFRSSGEFSVTFAQPPAADGACADHAAKLLGSLDLAAEETGTEEDGAGNTVVSFRQTLEGVPIYSCAITFRYAGGKLTAMDGTLLLSASISAAGETALDAPTALVRFLSGILDSGDVCSSVSALRPGYRMTASFSGGMTLSPVWLVSTDASDYYLDGITGALSRVS